MCVCVCVCVCVAVCVFTLRVESNGTSQNRGELLGDGMCWIRQRRVPPSLLIIKNRKGLEKKEKDCKMTE